MSPSYEGGAGMSGRKHTPGPWFATKDSQWNAIAHVGRAWNISTQLALSHFGDVDADANLIAAAPELLEALREIIADGVHCDVVPHLHRKALAAIAKATGSAA